jgi:hypothetical protein
MEKIPHTSAPWGFKATANCNDKPCRWEIIGGGGVIAETNDNTTEANARLIAAAPDLLEACESFLQMLKTGSNCDKRNPYTIPEVKAAISAILKAKGEA